MWKRLSVLTPARTLRIGTTGAPPTPPTRHPIIQTLPVVCGLLVLTMALTVLAGWALGIRGAKTLLFGEVTVRRSGNLPAASRTTSTTC